jgi:hypothetical protein
MTGRLVINSIRAFHIFKAEVGSEAFLQKRVTVMKGRWTQHMDCFMGKFIRSEVSGGLGFFRQVYSDIPWRVNGRMRVIAFSNARSKDFIGTIARAVHQLNLFKYL